LTTTRRTFAALAALCLVGCAANVVELNNQSEPSTAVQADLMTRWNAVAQGVTVGFDGMPGIFDFMWTNYNQFPHPTYKGGSGEAYQAFADILVAFYGRDDNFAFMAQNKLFRTPLRFTLSNSASAWTFEQLTNDLSSNAWAPTITSDTQQKLAAFADRIRMSP